jgi:sugar phosphate permease
MTQMPDAVALPQHGSHVKWLVLASGVAAQAAMSSLHHGLPAIGPYLRSELSLSLTEVGLVLAASNWGTMMMLVLWGVLTDRFGERLVTVLGLGSAGCVMLVAAQTDAPVEIAILLFLAGGLSSSAIAASGRSAMAWFGRNERGLALGIRQMAVTLGGGIAAVALPLAAVRWGIGGALSCLGGAFFAGGLIALAGLLPPRRTLAEPRLHGLPAPTRDWPMWRLSMCTGLFACGQIALASFLVIFLNEQRGFTPVGAASVLAGVQIAGGAARILSGHISDRSGLRIPQMRLQGIALAVMLVLSALLVDASAVLIVVVVVAAGVISVSWNGLAFTAAAEMAGYSKAGFALGLQGTVMRVVSAGAGVAFGAVVAGTSWSLAFACLALFPLAGALLLSPLIAEEKRRSTAQAA